MAKKPKERMRVEIRREKPLEGDPPRKEFMSPVDERGRAVDIQLVEGSLAPRRHTSDREVQLKRIVITEQGMTGQHGSWPLVDFELVDATGKRFWFHTSGTMVQTFAAAIAGVNLRNHGMVMRPGGGIVTAEEAEAILKGEKVDGDGN